MRLTVHIPQSESEALPAVLSLARSAPMFRSEGEHEAQVFVATFPDLISSLNLVERLVGEAIKLPEVLVLVDGRPVANLTKFWTALLCYQNSLVELDQHAYCERLSARLSGVSGCPDRRCVSHCQFICMRCLGITRESGGPPVAAQFLELARQAEVDWCPNLRLPSGC